MLVYSHDPYLVTLSTDYIYWLFIYNLPSHFWDLPRSVFKGFGPCSLKIRQIQTGGLQVFCNIPYFHGYKAPFNTGRTWIEAAEKVIRILYKPPFITSRTTENKWQIIDFWSVFAVYIDKFACRKRKNPFFINDSKHWNNKNLIQGALI